MNEQNHHRKGERVMQSIIDSPWAKILLAVLQGVIVVFLWIGSTALGSFTTEMRNMRVTLDSLATSKEVMQTQIKTLEAYKLTDEQSTITIRERLSSIESDVRNLKDKRP